jgi:protein-tyrosine-phosphatase
MAEVIFSNICKKAKRRDITVKSAGTNAAVGCDMSMEAKIALNDGGERLPRKKHSAAQFTQNMFYEFDHIICMTAGHKISACGYDITSVPPNIRTLNEWVGCGDIEDPYRRGQETYYAVCKKLQDALNLLYKEIIK